jgi:hypothetical protein
VRGRLIVVTLIAGLAATRAAHAGLNRFGWLADTDVLPERQVELGQWLGDERRLGPDHAYETSLWWGPLIGVTDQVEVAFPVEWVWVDSDSRNPSTRFTRYGVEARWRLVSADPVEAPAWVPVIQAAVRRPLADPIAADVSVDGVIGYDCGRIHAVGNLGVSDELRRGLDTSYLRGGAGVSVRVATGLRLGLEAYGELATAGATDEDWIVVGPDLSWTHGRFWLSATVPVGVYQINLAPRLNWAVAF